MLRTQFEEELNKLHNQFYSMGTQVSVMIVSWQKMSLQAMR